MVQEEEMLDMFWGFGNCVTRAVRGVRQPQSVQVGAQTGVSGTNLINEIWQGMEDFTKHDKIHSLIVIGNSIWMHRDTGIGYAYIRKMQRRTKTKISLSRERPWYEHGKYPHPKSLKANIYYIKTKHIWVNISRSCTHIHIHTYKQKQKNNKKQTNKQLNKQTNTNTYTLRLHLYLLYYVSLSLCVC